MLQSASIALPKAWSLPAKQPMSGIRWTIDKISLQRSSTSSSSAQPFPTVIRCLKQPMTTNSMVSLSEDDDSKVLASDHSASMGSGGSGGEWKRGLGGPSGPKPSNTDLYYQRMLHADPCNPLIAANYARFLKEVCGDNAKAEVYCERAMVANSGDASVLCMYGDLIWENYNDAPRAKGYFDLAVEASPDNCYVLASYAHFLWDSEQDSSDA